MQIMKALVLFVLVCVGHCSAKHVAENDKRAESEEFNTNKIQLGSEEVLIVTAADGENLATIDVFEEGYEITLTPDGSKCLLSQVRDNSSCFDEVPFDEDTLEDNEAMSARIADLCKDREIVTLKPVDCDANDGLNGDKRFGKRGWCTYYSYHQVCRYDWWYNSCSVQSCYVSYYC
ncbi:uncharacterized protein LOC127854165 [Dreissena polymorpha]|uniref:Uncharacterized protein n=1 Tax=Dreissena polymorpha TaxID=45954 RepID=A0A9D4CGI0_DREPO|nr:uncharacterized protein LOC127854165 [Dreissena polymorpha]KAH3723965.1 hypothetical protein DPMN_049763 [Dreissena polymorpha]